ncbi:MAG: hypothetical protein V5B36_11660 [Candidatus Accumulibacter sp. UW25]|jgi:hypothetical protein
MKSVLILGGHRSGTSCLAGSLQQHGLYLGEVFERNSHNLKGNRENAEIMRLNNSLLEYNEGSWDNPPQAMKWSADHASCRDQIVAKFCRSGYPLWGFKDPRTLLTLDFWLDGLSGCSLRFAGSFRHPAAVANSLMLRNSMAIDSGLHLWKIYNSKLLQKQKEIGFEIIHFDAESLSYQRSLARVLEKIGIAADTNIPDVFFDKDLIHNGASHLDGLPKDVGEIYSELLQIFNFQELARHETR